MNEQQLRALKDYIRAVACTVVEEHMGRDALTEAVHERTMEENLNQCLLEFDVVEDEEEAMMAAGFDRYGKL